MTPPISFGRLHWLVSLLFSDASAPRRISRKASDGVMFFQESAVAAPLQRPSSRTPWREGPR
jgi:hypothetical protein